MQVANIIVQSSSVQLDRVFDYLVPNELLNSATIGSRVIVPFGNRKIEGYIIGISDNTDIPIEKMKYIKELVDDEKLFDEKAIKLATWMSKRYVCSMSAVLSVMIPKPLKIVNKNGNIQRTVKDKKIEWIKLIISKDELKELIEELPKKSTKKKAIMELFLDNEKLTYDFLREFLGITRSNLDKLIEEGIFEIEEEEAIRKVYDESNYKKSNDRVLTDEQQKAHDEISECIEKNQFARVLVHGVTGSGKTEIYLQLIKKVINAGKECVMLVPEISLTPQMVERFVSRFGSLVAVFHSKLTDGQKYDQWKLIREGRVKIVVGARSAIFSPFKNLGLVIIDEEHESSYKSGMTPRYDAIEVAEALCSLNKCVLVMGSATPSLESYYEAENGNIKLIKLYNRVESRPMPVVEVADMREELLNGNKTILSKLLREEIAKNLNNKEKIILFLNQRGYFTFATCKKCGYVIKCPHCDVSMKYHFNNNKLVCHYCGHQEVMQKICASCGSEYVKYSGFGTERVEEEIQLMFPHAKILRMDTDTTKKKGNHEKILNTFKNEDTDILIGTQMIAKGLDIADVTLVGVISADTMLNMDDFRSAEKTFELLEQVAGRAGRGEIAGRVVIQTSNPEHYSIEFTRLHDYEGFYKKECISRKVMMYPPFTRIVGITISGEDHAEVAKASNEIKRMLGAKIQKEAKILGPVECSISKIKDRYRWRIILKIFKLKKVLDVLNLLRYDIIKNSTFKKVLVDIDVNPRDLI